jgi:hypothetical protein
MYLTNLKTFLNLLFPLWTGVLHARSCIRCLAVTRDDSQRECSEPVDSFSTVQSSARLLLLHSPNLDHCGPTTFIAFCPAYGHVCGWYANAACRIPCLYLNVQSVSGSYRLSLSSPLLLYLLLLYPLIHLSSTRTSTTHSEFPLLCPRRFSQIVLICLSRYLLYAKLNAVPTTLSIDGVCNNGLTLPVRLKARRHIVVSDAITRSPSTWCVMQCVSGARCF